MLNAIYPIIINWNLKSDTIACIQSLLEAGIRLDHIIVLDNGSDDGSYDALRTTFGNSLQLLRCEENIGFTAGLNMAVQHCLLQNPHWLFLLNNDTLVSPEIFEEFQVTPLHEKDYAILGPSIFRLDNPSELWFSGDRLVKGTLLTKSIGSSAKSLVGYEALVPVDFLSGCGMLVRRDVFNAIGLFDASLFMYAEELDFCWRARQAGFRIGFVRNAKMWHRISASSNKVKPLARYLKTRNQIHFYIKYSRSVALPLMFIFSLIKACQTIFNDMMSRDKTLVGPVIKGLYDGWTRSLDLPSRHFLNGK